MSAPTAARVSIVSEDLPLDPLLARGAELMGNVEKVTRGGDYAPMHVALHHFQLGYCSMECNNGPDHCRSNRELRKIVIARSAVLTDFMRKFGMRPPALHKFFILRDTDTQAIAQMSECSG